MDELRIIETGNGPYVINGDGMMLSPAEVIGLANKLIGTALAVGYEPPKPKRKRREASEPADPAIEQAITDVIEFLNESAGTSYRPSTESHRKAIRARLRDDGYTVAECKSVIRKKCRDWRGTEYAKYLSPGTLFAKSHFDKYLNQPTGGLRNAEYDRV